MDEHEIAFPPLPSIEHLLDLEERVAKMSEQDYNDFVHRVAGAGMDKTAVL